MTARSHSLVGLALAVLAACAGDDLDSAGGAGEGHGSTECLDFGACGGDAVGRWEVEETCFTDGLPEAAPDPYCPGAVSRVVDYVAEGSLELRADGTYATQTTGATTQEMLIPLDTCFGGEAVACELYGESLAYAYAGAGCEVADDTCACTLTLTAALVDAGTWSSVGSSLTLTSDVYGTTATQDYCVDGASLALATEVTSFGPMVGVWRRAG